MKDNWKSRYINGIKENGIECWWSLIKIDGLSRFYKITLLYPQDENGMITSKEPEYYVLWECTEFDQCGFGNDCFDGINPHNFYLVHVFKDLKSAKKRAVLQLQKIADIKKAYFTDVPS